MRLVVVGGGISGLAAARGAISRAPYVPGGLEVVVLEREAEVGGKARTLQADGFLVEAGPTGFLSGEPALDRLIDAAGLSDERIAADPAAARRFLARDGRLVEVRPHPLAFARSGLLGPLGLARIALEPLVRRGRADDESVHDFACRRLGRQAAERLIAPMVLGVFAGDARRLSLPAAFPRLAALEREHGSLVRGMIAKRRSAKAAGDAGTVGGPAGPAGRLESFRGGLQALPRALAADGRFSVRTGARVVGLAVPPGGGWRIALERGEPLDADALVLACEPWAQAELLRDAAPEIAAELAAIACPAVAVVALGYGGEALAKVPRGFGALVPRGEGLRILGCLWDTHLFAGRSPHGRLLVRAMLGGAVDPDAAALDDGELAAIAKRDVAALCGLGEEPGFERVVRWPRAIPQYELGHLARVQRIELALEARPRLFLAGNGLHGIAFGKAAAAGWFEGERAARRLAGVAGARA